MKYSPPSPPQPVFSRLMTEARRLRLKKRFAQHFLVNEGVLERIAGLVQSAGSGEGADGGGETILEIGAGAGFLTEKLLERGSAQLVAVELEREMVAYLRRKFPVERHPHFRLIESDILRFDFDAVEAPTFKVVGNLPYQITSKILFLLAGELEQPDYPLRKRIRQLTVLVQKEVAERIAAQPGQRAYNPLSIALQMWFEPRLDFLVPARDFYPAPKVESAVVTLLPREQPLVSVPDMGRFARLVRAAFSQKRKTIRNALLHAGFTDDKTMERVFASVGVRLDLRAEAISIETFGMLANAFDSNPRQD